MKKLGVAIALTFFVLFLAQFSFAQSGHPVSTEKQDSIDYGQYDPKRVLLDMFPEDEAVIRQAMISSRNSLEFQAGIDPQSDPVRMEICLGVIVALLENGSEGIEDFAAVMGHEWGHWKKNHLPATTVVWSFDPRAQEEGSLNQSYEYGALPHSVMVVVDAELETAQQIEADRVAFDALRRSGRNPCAIARVLRLIKSLDEESGPSSEQLDKRIAALACPEE
ncbi:MAG: M48 family metalloprotease [Patescibacteria group bacterium]